MNKLVETLARKAYCPHGISDEAWKIWEGRPDCVKKVADIIRLLDGHHGWTLMPNKETKKMSARATVAAYRGQVAPMYQAMIAARPDPLAE